MCSGLNMIILWLLIGIILEHLLLVGSAVVLNLGGHKKRWWKNVS